MAILGQFWQKFVTFLQKWSKNEFLLELWTIFVKIFDWIEQKQVFVTIVQNWPIFKKRSPKNEQQFFSKKI